MLNQSLIEKALALTGKTMEDMNVLSSCELTSDPQPYYNGEYIQENRSFSIEKFCYYLHSPEFIEKYTEKIDSECESGWGVSKESVIDSFGFAIHEYQLGNEKPLKDLLAYI